MDELDFLLTHPLPSGVYFLESSASPEVVEKYVISRGYCFLYLDGEHIFDVLKFYDEFGLMIDYPQFGGNSGGNANRLWDVLGDLERWTDKCQQNINGYVVLYTQFENWHQNDTDPNDLYGIKGTINLIREALAEQRVIDENELYRKGAVGSFGQYFLLQGDKAIAAQLGISPIS